MVIVLPICGIIILNTGPVIRYPLYLMCAFYYIQVIYTCPGLYIFAHTTIHSSDTAVVYIYNICGASTYIKYKIRTDTVRSCCDHVRLC